MIVTLTAGAPVSTVNAILAAAAAAGCESRTFDDGHGGTVVGVAGTVAVAGLPGINAVLEKHRPYMLASREGPSARSPTVVKVGGVRIGGGRPVVIGGPCVIEEPRIAARGGASDESRRGRHVARRRLQAPHLPLRVPGTRRRGAALPGRGARGDRVCRW